MRVVEKILPLPGLSLVCVAEAVDGQQGSACPQGAPGM
jgi:hypothetical protein